MLSRRQFIIGVMLTLAGLGVGCDRKQETNVAAPPNAPLDPKEKELASLPVGIEVTHRPNPVKAQVGGVKGYAYAWVYKTSVKTLGGPLTIQEFGSFSWFHGQWVFTNYTHKPFTAANFAGWYSCPDARLVPGQTFSDTSNWSAGNEVKASKARWYYIATNDKGERVKGEAVIEQLGEIAQ
jgi:hypothetical protein